MNNFIALIAAGFAFYFYSQKQKEDHKKDLEASRKEQEAEREYYDEQIKELQNKIDPNGNIHQPPVSITGEVIMGGLTLNQLEINLIIANTSKDVNVELVDWRCEISVGGIVSQRVFPSNINGIIIPKNQKRVFKLYARGDEAFPGGLYKSVKESLLNIANIASWKKGLDIPFTSRPAELDIKVLWDVEGNREETQFFNVPCSFYWPYAGWTVGGYVGYNAGKKNQQKMNPSYWEIYDTHDEE